MPNSSKFVHHLDHHSLPCHKLSSFFFVRKGMGVILMFPMQLVTVEVKVDSSSLIKVIMSINVNLDLGEVSDLSQILNLKLSSVAVLWRKEVK
jgi:hypothetical protein